MRRYAHRRIALVGSVPLENAESVFNTVGSKLGDLAKRIPDGETGVRNQWIVRQARVFHDHPAFEPVSHDWSPDQDIPAKPPAYRLKRGADANDLTISSFGYAQYAKDSYNSFLKARNWGTIPAETRFQVCLPTPLSFYASSLIEPGSSEAVAPAVERRIRAEAKEIVQSIPARDLALQWDVCIEIFVWEGARPTFFKEPKKEIIQRLVELGELIPSEVELGYHFCYGDFQHKHAIEPTDMGTMVSMANAVQKRLAREITWVHMPVPRDRNDPAYFRPLTTLELSSYTEVYLGLVHHTDGVAGTRRRIDIAESFLPEFGIATECGWGRRSPISISSLLDIHVACASRSPPDL
jgi:hypothetical protein